MSFFIAAAILDGLSVLYLLLWKQKDTDSRLRQMDLFAAALLMSCGSVCLAKGLESALNGSLDPFALLWVVLAISLILLIVLALALPALLSAGPFGFLQKILSALCFWIPKEQPVQTSEIEMLLDAGNAQEKEEQREVIENALDLGETTLDEICTHRSDMISLSLKDDPAKWKQVILKNRHTFYPITNEGDDDIAGILDTRDYFRLDGFGKKNIMDHCVDKPLFAAENTTADELLHIMKNRRTYIAIVLDEYGGVVGLVTLHDIIEELFGELSEEEEKRQADIVKLPRGVWRISGEADLEDVSKALGVPLELDDFETFSGYVLGSMGYIPEDGSQLEVQIGPLNVQIKRIAGHRIRQALVRVDQPDAETSPAPETHKEANR